MASMEPCACVRELGDCFTEVYTAIQQLYKSDQTAFAEYTIMEMIADIQQCLSGKAQEQGEGQGTGQGTGQGE